MREEAADYHQAAATVKPIRMPPMPCPTCGSVQVPVLFPGTGPHVAKAVSACCQRFIRWLPKALVEGKEEGMSGVARCTIVGCIGKYGVEVRYAQSGAPCASFTLVVSERGQDGKMHELWVPCEAWGKKAEGISELEAGTLCLFEGKLAKRKKADQWDWVVAGFDVMPIMMPSLTGSTN
jgi:Single-strand binding protein family